MRWEKERTFGEFGSIQKRPNATRHLEANQTVRSRVMPKSIRISFPDQRLTAHGGFIVGSHVLHQKKFRATREHLPHDPRSFQRLCAHRPRAGVPGRHSLRRR